MTIAQQIARTVLGVDDVVLDPIDTPIGSAGSTSASRQTWMSGGAVDAACRAVRERLFEHVGAAHGIDPLRFVIDGADVVDSMGDLRVPVAEATAGAALRRDRRVPPPPDRGPRRERPGQLPHGVRVRRPPRRRRRRPRARPRQGRAGRHRPGRRPGPQPAVGARPDRGRHRPGPRAGGDGGDRPDRRPDPQRQLHRLPAADVPRHARRRRHADRGARPAGPARRQGRRRAAVHLGRPRRSSPPSATPCARPTASASRSTACPSARATSRCDAARGASPPDRCDRRRLLPTDRVDERGDHDVGDVRRRPRASSPRWSPTTATSRT